MGPRALRLLRGFAAAMLSTLVALLFHLAGGGALAAPLLLGAVVVFSTIVCLALAGRRVSTARLIPAVGASQVLFHVLFAGAAGSSPAAAAGSIHARHARIGVDPVAAADLAGTGMSIVSTAQAPTSMALTPLMALSHLAAAVLTVLALRFGEGALVALLALARRTSVLRLASLAAGIVDRQPTPPRPAITAGTLPCAQQRRWAALTLHRGPPAFAVTSVQSA